MTGTDAVENRAAQLINEASDEIVLVIGDDSLFTPELANILRDVDEDVDLLVGALSESLVEEIQAEVPRAKTFISGLEWLRGGDAGTKETAIGRLLLIDRSTILVSSIVPDSKEEQAIFGEGFGNGLVVIARRLMAQGLLPVRDPAA